ncbi:autotransporter outer membrane beta-barrel domain-containing protein [Devosia sp. FKR38]|uniref:autotransporter family protein n=1 Tax=Devosia sp. FKR38 TaxID=2562312 RepID=UPI001484C99C|nr:autotransporter outer membrane beta-barrel domain-containing protein [Devosia sp. FKR38]
MPTNNFIIDAVNGSFNPTLSGGTISLGTITVSDFTLTLNNNVRLTTAGIIVNNGGGLSTRVNTGVTGNITVNAGGLWTVNSAIGVTGNVTNAGTLTLGGNAVTGIGTLTNSGTVTGSDGLQAATIVNSGTITGTTYGLSPTSALTLTNSGTISGGTAAVRLGVNGNTININPGSVFTGGIDYNNTTGNTTAFGAGSYTLAVQNYSTTGNTVTTANASTVVNMTSNGAVVYSATGAPPVQPAAAAVPAAAAPAVTPAPVVSTTPTTTINVVNMASVTNSTAVQSSSYASNISGMIGDVMAIGDLTSGVSGASSDSGDAGSNVLGYVEIVKPKSKPVAAIDAAIAKPQTMPAQGQVVDGAGNVFWSRAFGGAQYTPAQNGSGALSSYYYGAAIGIDHRFDTWRLGAYLGGGKASQGVLDGSGDMDGSVVFGGLYGHNDQNDFITDLGLSLGKLSNNSKRYINNGAQTATGSFGGLFVAPEAALGYRFELTDGWDVVPSVKLRYTGSFYDGYSETGSTQNVAYSDQSVHMFDERAQIKLTHTEQSDTGLKQQYYVQGSVQGSQRVGDSNLNATVSGTSYAVTASGDKSLLAGSVGAGFDLNVTQAAAVYGGADATFYTNGAQAVAGRVGLKLSF